MVVLVVFCGVGVFVGTMAGVGVVLVLVMLVSVALVEVGGLALVLLIALVGGSLVVYGAVGAGVGVAEVFICVRLELLSICRFTLLRSRADPPDLTRADAIRPDLTRLDPTRPDQNRHTIF